MLRWSSEENGYQIDPRGVTDASIYAGLPGARVLVALVDSFLLGDESSQERARHEALDVLGSEGFVDAAAVFGNFEMMNRVAEGTGVPVPPQRIEREAEMIERLGLRDIMKTQHR